MSTEKTRKGKWTPGPWICVLDPESAPLIIKKREGDNIWIAEGGADAGIGADEAAANAALIADAPRLHDENQRLKEQNAELLEALQACVYVGDGHYSHDTEGASRENCEACRDRRRANDAAHAAIAKAERGES